MLIRHLSVAILSCVFCCSVFAAETCPKGYGYKQPIDTIDNDNLNTANTTVGGIDSNGNYENNSHYRTNNYTEIPVESGKVYIFTTNDTKSYKYLATYDAHHNFIGRVNVADFYSCAGGVSYVIPILYVDDNGDWDFTPEYTYISFRETILRTVGDYADVLDYNNGTIIRNIGVKILNGTESFEDTGTSNVSRFHGMGVLANTTILSTHYKSQLASVSIAQMGINEIKTHGTINGLVYIKPSSDISNAQELRNYLAEQYANGTPVTIYYPLATPVIETASDFTSGQYVTSVIGDYCSLCSPNTYKDSVGNSACTPCPNGLVSPSGATSVDECGRILHIGNYMAFMSAGRRTEHGLCTMLNNVKYCADLYEKY